MNVLSVSYDSSLLQSREHILRKLGLRVTSALGFNAAIRQCEKADFDLFVLGHSIPIGDRQSLILEFQRKCAAPVVELNRPDSHPTGLAQYVFDSTRHPRELAEVVANILGLDASDLQEQQKELPDVE